MFERANRWFTRLSPEGRIAAAVGALIVCGALLTLAISLAGGESGPGRPTTGIYRGGRDLLRGGCTLAREDGALEQVTLTGAVVNGEFCQRFASYLEENVGVEEHTWRLRTPAKPITRENCASCSVTPACSARIAAPGKPRSAVLFLAESEEAYDELHYYPIYTHDICELLNGRVEIERFIEREAAR